MDRPAPLLCSIYWHRDRADQLRSRMALPRRPYAHQAEHHPSWRPRILQHWRHQHVAALRHWHRYQSRYADAERWAHSAGPACVSHNEGGLTSVNPAGPYYGKWQADRRFEAAYNRRALARWGDANHWPERDQDLMAYHGWQAHGWKPWPATSAMCGL